jgi:acyl carrier protein
MADTSPIALSARVQAVLAETLKVPIEQAPTTLAFGDLPQWDSMGHMEVMMRLEQEFGIEINADTIASLISIPAICEHVAKIQISGESHG